MPLGSTNHPAPSPPPDPIFPGTLPEEVYVRVEFDDHDKAKNWCESVTATLARPILELGPFDRIVLWAPEQYGASAYLSVLAIRVLRSHGSGYLPVRELVSMAQFPVGLKLVLGNPADERAYRNTKA